MDVYVLYSFTQTCSGAYMESCDGLDRTCNICTKNPLGDGNCNRTHSKHRHLLCDSLHKTPDIGRMPESGTGGSLQSDQSLQSPRIEPCIVGSIFSLGVGLCQVGSTPNQLLLWWAPLELWSVLVLDGTFVSLLVQHATCLSSVIYRSLTTFPLVPNDSASFQSNPLSLKYVNSYFEFHCECSVFH